MLQTMKENFSDGRLSGNVKNTHDPDRVKSHEFGKK